MSLLTEERVEFSSGGRDPKGKYFILTNGVGGFAFLPLGKRNPSRFCGVFDSRGVKFLDNYFISVSDGSRSEKLGEESIEAYEYVPYAMAIQHRALGSDILEAIHYPRGLDVIEIKLKLEKDLKVEFTPNMDIRHISEDPREIKRYRVELRPDGTAIIRCDQDKFVSIRFSGSRSGVIYRPNFAAYKIWRYPKDSRIDGISEGYIFNPGTFEMEGRDLSIVISSAETLENSLESSRNLEIRRDSYLARIRSEIGRKLEDLGVETSLGDLKKAIILSFLMISYNHVHDRGVFLGIPRVYFFDFIEFSRFLEEYSYFSSRDLVEKLLTIGSRRDAEALGYLRFVLALLRIQRMLGDSLGEIRDREIEDEDPRALVLANMIKRELEFLDISLPPSLFEFLSRVRRADLIDCVEDLDSIDPELALDLVRLDDARINEMLARRIGEANADRYCERLRMGKVLLRIGEASRGLDEIMDVIKRFGRRVLSTLGDMEDSGESFLIHASYLPTLIEICSLPRFLMGLEISMRSREVRIDPIWFAGVDRMRCILRAGDLRLSSEYRIQEDCVRISLVPRVATSLQAYLKLRIPEGFDLGSIVVNGNDIDSSQINWIEIEKPRYQRIAEIRYPLRGFIDASFKIS